MVICSDNRLHDVFCKLDVVAVIGSLAADMDRSWRSMRVCCGHQHVIDVDASRLGDLFLGVIKHFATRHALIDHDDGDFGLPITQDQSAGVQGIMHGRCRTVLADRSVQRDAHRWRDVNFRSTRTEFRGSDLAQEKAADQPTSYLPSHCPFDGFVIHR
jgi:hypothetical protein